MKRKKTKKANHYPSRLNIRMEGWLMTRLKNKAKEHKTTPSVIARSAISYYLKPV
jgi:hypothetical protein